MHSSKSFDKRLRLLKKERYFQMVCVQIVILNHKILRLQKRYKKTNQENLQSLRYNMRLRLAAVEGVRNMFYDVAKKTANQIAELQRELFGEAVFILTKSAMEDIAEWISAPSSITTSKQTALFRATTFSRKEYLLICHQPSHANKQSSNPYPSSQI